MWLNVLIIVFILLVLIVVIALIRALRFGQTPPAAESLEGIAVDSDQVAQHLSKIIQVESISMDNEPARQAKFEEVHTLLEKFYPRVHATLKRETINECSLLYTWEGTDPSLKPVAFLAHQDVVPADPATLNQWTYPPFSGEIADGFVWGRGALDMKNHLVGIFEAAENLLEAGFQPRRTIYLASGHDEEIGGQHGAVAAAALLAERGIELEAVLDEGGMILEGFLPGIPGKVALIGNEEKGHINVELSVQQSPGHSSTPPAHSAIGILAAAITRLENNPMPAQPRALLPMMSHMGRKLPFSYRLLFANLWLFGGILKSVLEKNSKTNASIRTTMAATMISGGIKPNVLPTVAQANVNCRILPGYNIDQTVAHIHRVIADERVTIKVNDGFCDEPSPVSPIEGGHFTEIAQTVRGLFGDVSTTPFLMLGGTDSRHYTGICPNVYRFAPVQLTADDLGRVHGIDERIAVSSLGDMVRFFAQIMQTWAK
ncbi:MAG: M20 family peptidase [Anaerolineales bacterium]|nr:M20 family peptidase [Anaerolineales bacterium]